VRAIKLANVIKSVVLFVVVLIYWSCCCPKWRLSLGHCLLPHRPLEAISVHLLKYAARIFRLLVGLATLCMCVCVPPVMSLLDKSFNFAIGLAHTKFSMLLFAHFNWERLLYWHSPHESTIVRSIIVVWSHVREYSRECVLCSIYLLIARPQLYNPHVARCVSSRFVTWPISGLLHQRLGGN